MREGAMHQVREQGLSRTPGEPGSSARDPSEAGEPKGEPWHLGLTLQPPAQLFAHHQCALAGVPCCPCSRTSQTSACSWSNKS